MGMMNISTRKTKIIRKEREGDVDDVAEERGVWRADLTGTRPSFMI